MARNKFSRSVFPVMVRRCAECLFSPNKIVTDERRKEILKSCARDDSHFECHKGTLAGEEICCRGFYDARQTNLMRMAEGLGVIVWIDPDTIEQVEAGEPAGDEQP